MNAKLIMAVVATSVLATGCATTGSAVSYGDAQAVETLTKDFGSTDLQMIAAKMVDDMLTFPPVVQMTQTRRPVIVLDRIHNKTQEHIDTESITDTIQNKLINSGKFRFCRYEICQCDGAATCLSKTKRHGQSSDCSAYWWTYRC